MTIASKIGLYRHPPVDPVTGGVSAADDAVLMGQMRHCDVPPPHRKDDCQRIMHDHHWIDNGIENGDGTIGITVCPKETGMDDEDALETLDIDYEVAGIWYLLEQHGIKPTVPLVSALWDWHEHHRTCYLPE